MQNLQRILLAAFWGGIAGLATLALDYFLAFLTLGLLVDVAARFIVIHALTGAVVGVLAEATRLLSRRQRADAFWHVAVTMATLYGASIFERVHQALALRVPSAINLAASAAAVLGYVGWVFLVQRLLRSKLGAQSMPHALIWVVLCVAVGLAVNRNMITHPLELAALAADFIIVAGGLALIGIVRLAGPRPATIATLALTTAATLAVVFEPWKDDSATRKKTRNPRGQPHLILAIVDTLRQDVFRSVVDQTEEGQAFRRAVGHASWFDNTASVAPWTAPSVASIMTGLFPPEHGFGATSRESKSRPLTSLSSSAKTLAQTLRNSGYQNMGIVTNALLHPVTGIARGFHSYELLADATSKMPLLTVLVRAGLIERELYVKASAVRRHLQYRLPELTASGRPAFLWLHLMDPHFPLHGHPDLPPDPVGAKLPEKERLYREETRYALIELTRMIEMIKTEGLWENAAFVFLADHGEMFESDHHSHLPPKNVRLYGHGHALYNELVKVPLVIRPPGGLPEERRVDALVSQTDLHDTLIDMLNLNVPTADDRVSVAPWLRPELPKEPVPRRTYTLLGSIQSGPRHRAVRTTDLKLIKWTNGELPEELYDLTSDPGETRNLASARPQLRAELEELFDFTWGQLEVATDARDLELNEETRQRLKALGYLE